MQIDDTKVVASLFDFSRIYPMYIAMSLVDLEEFQISILLISMRMFIV